MVNLKIVSQVVTAGTPGPAGKSAYQAAVDNGFEGTEKEWLDSLLPFKGWYTSENELVQKQPHPLFGDYAYVHTNSGTFLYHCTTNDGEGTWTNSGTQVDTSNINTFATNEPLNTVGISTDLSDAGHDEYLVKQSLITRSVAEMRCTSLGLDPIKEIPNFTPVNGMTYKVRMVHANETNEAVVFKMGDTVAPLYYEGEAASATNTWKDGEVIEIYYREAALESGDETCFYAHSILNTFATGESVGSTGIDAIPTEGSKNLLKSGGAKDAIDAIAEDMSELDERKANKDGVYSQMTVGAAETLVGQSVNSEEYLVRPAGGKSNEVANGIAEVVGLEGQSCVWNQLNSDTSTKTKTFSTTTLYWDEIGYLSKSISFTAAHKYYIRANVDNGISGDNRVRVGYENAMVDRPLLIVSGSGISGNIVQFNKDTVFSTVYVSNYWYKRGFTEGDYISISDLIVIDLTLLGIDNLTTVAEVEAWLAQHVGTKPRYAYKSGTILSAQTLGFKTYGQNLLNPTTRQAKLIPYSWEENSNVYTIKNVPSGATATFTPDNTGISVTVDISGGTLDITNYGSGILELSAATANTYVCMKWDEQKDNDVVPYEEHTYNFDVTKVYGQVNGTGDYVQCFPEGMKSAKNIHDELSPTYAIKRTEILQMGNLSWQLSNSRFVCNPVPVPAGSYNIICSRYPTSTAGGLPVDGYITNSDTVGSSSIWVNDSKYTGVADFKAAMAGETICISRKFPITYTNLVYRDNGVDTPLDEVLLQMQVNNWSMEEQLITPYANGNPTSIPATVNTIYSIDAVEALDTLNKNCYFADDVKDNLQALLTCINTNCSETLGGTFSISETATDKVFAFSFTPNTEPDVEPTNEGE